MAGAPGVAINVVSRDRRPLVFLLAAALVWALLFLVRPSLHAGDGLAADYFTNSEWQGPPAFSVVDAQPSTAAMAQRWHGAPPERFSVQWTGFLAIGRPAWFTFTTTSDDGSELFVDNRLVVDNSGSRGVVTRSDRIHLEGGSHLVVLRYARYGGAYALEWSWSRDNGERAAVPAWVLSQRRARYATAVAARIVDWGTHTVTILVLLAAAWYVRAGPLGEAGARLAALGFKDLRNAYRTTASLVFSILAFTSVLAVPWPDGGPQRFYGSVEATLRDLNGTAGRVLLGGFGTFQANINRPQPAENVLPGWVQEMLAMLRRHGIEQYKISSAIASDDWVRQQIVASAWPRKLEPSAAVSFVLNDEPVAPGCTVVERQRDVSLVYCP
jgi:hypothetical protein